MPTILTRGSTALAVDVDEVNLQLGLVPRETIAVYFNGAIIPNFPGTHYLLRITSKKTKSHWALDFAGGQYGICNPLWKWTDYATRFVKGSSLMDVYPSGTNKELFEQLGDVNGEPSMIYGVVENVVKAMNEATDAMVSEGRLDLAGFHSLNEDDYNAQKTLLLNTLDMAARNYIDIKAKHEIAEVFEANNIKNGGHKESDLITDLFFSTRQGLRVNPLADCKVVDANGVTKYYIF